MQKQQQQQQQMHNLLRGNESDRFLGNGRSTYWYEETREERNLRTPGEMGSSESIVDASDRNHKNQYSYSNYEFTTTNDVGRLPSPESDPSRSFISTSDDVHRSSGDDMDSNIGLGDIDALPRNHEHKERRQQNGDYPIDDSGNGFKDIIIMGILVGLIVILVINFVFLVYEPVVQFVKRKLRRLAAENPRIIERRYKTIDRWLIQKTVQPHDATCEHIQNYSRMKNGESSLGTYRSAVISTIPSPVVASNTKESYPPLRLAPSFDTNTTKDCSSSSGSSCSTSSSTSSDRNGSDAFLSNCKVEILECDDDISRNRSTAAKNSEMSGSRSGIEIDNANQLIDKTSLPAEFEIEHDGDRQQPSEREKSLPTPSPDKCTGGKDSIANSSTILLSREQILEKLEIIKSKAKPFPNNASYQGGVSRNTEKGEHDGEVDYISDEELNDNENSRQECSICMEPFYVGDKISFSPDGGCQHVFHHDCLREWLLRKTGCPCCRITMLPIDRNRTGDCQNSRNNYSDSDDEASSEAHRASNTMSIPHQRWSPFMRQLPLLPKDSPTKQPWNHRNPEVLRERRNKKCGTYSCVACGVVVLKTNLREDLLCARAPLPQRCNGGRPVTCRASF